MGKGQVDRWDLSLWTTYGTILTTEVGAIDRVRQDVLDEIELIEQTCSRFRPDSEVSVISARPGVPVLVSPLLSAMLRRAQRGEEWTRGAFSVGVGGALQRLGYDEHWPSLSKAIDGPSSWVSPGYDQQIGTYCARPGEVLDFGSIGKAFAAERIAELISNRTDGGVLVNLGGDIAVAGRAPEGGWRIEIDDDLTNRAPVIAMTNGALATSSILRRAWNDSSGAARHHIIDPRTGLNPALHWATVSVAAHDAVDANIAATASIVLGAEASGFLASSGLSARLVGINGSVHYVGNWPTDRVRAVA